MKFIAGLIAIVIGSLLMYVVSDLPDWGDPNAPANAYVSSYYLEFSYADTHVPNVVTSVLADYRGFDTMFETAVVFVAFIGIVAVLKRKKSKNEKPVPYDNEDSLILRVATDLMVPFMQIFALYVIAHGHYSPGGGFQGGVILGASFIIMAMARDLEYALKQFSENKYILFGAIGVLIYSGIGVVCMMLGSEFLNYSVLSKILPGIDSVMARSHSMLAVEVGVALTVMSGMFAIYVYLASDGQKDRGL